ncbi:MAG: hypothetical protein ACTTJH_04450 [Bacteroidales bacterium]
MKKIIVFALCLHIFAIANSQKGLYHNRFVVKETGTDHTFVLNSGLNIMDKNKGLLYSKIKRIPVVLYCEFGSNKFLYGKFVYVNFAFTPPKLSKFWIMG